MEKIKKIAFVAVKKAGQFALKKYYTFNRSDAKLKAHKELLTEVDLYQRLRKIFPIIIFYQRNQEIIKVSLIIRGL
ncbi:hypothetical protein K8R32_04780 [bacterium]|nr:hypothetical protein [bacterium]